MRRPQKKKETQPQRQEEAGGKGQVLGCDHDILNRESEKHTRAGHISAAQKTTDQGAVDQGGGALSGPWLYSQAISISRLALY